MGNGSVSDTEICTINTRISQTLDHVPSACVPSLQVSGAGQPMFAMPDATHLQRDAAFLPRTQFKIHPIARKTHERSRYC